MSRDPFDLTGKVALVAGSTMGTGEGTARVLSRAGSPLGDQKPQAGGL